MRRGSQVIRLVTTNRHKFLEASEVLSRYGVEAEWVRYKPQEIQSDSLLEVVIWKGFDAKKVVPPPFVVEDTGLFIDALGGFPGVYSSYVLSTLGIRGVLKALEGVEDRGARFVSYGLLYLGDNMFKVFRAVVEGRIAMSPRGEGGFGYDPIFIPLGGVKTFGEMSLEEKNRYSHRAGLFNKIGRYLTSLSIGETVISMLVRGGDDGEDAYQEEG